MLSKAERSPDGGYRAIASRQIPGTILGGFLHYGTRSDDPNDVVPHEHRRSLRGLAVFAAWIDRVDAKNLNTLDTLVEENGRRVVRHYILDFGSTLGSAGTGPRAYDEGYEYIVEGKSTLKHLLGVGFPVPSYRKIPYNGPRAVGRFQGVSFDPDAWRSRVPNAAYLRARADDTFWAARKLAAMTDDLIAAAVKTGRYSDPAAAAYLTRALTQRSDIILKAYLPRINPLVNPSLDARTGTLRLENAAVMADVARAPKGYEALWYRFDNATGETTLIADPASADVAHLTAPPGLPATPGSYIRVDLSAIDPPNKAWFDPVQIYFRRTAAGEWKLVGLERLPEVGR